MANIPTYDPELLERNYEAMNAAATNMNPTHARMLREAQRNAFPAARQTWERAALDRHYVLRDRRDRLSRLKRRPLWRKAYDAIVYVVTGREP